MGARSGGTGAARAFLLRAAAVTAAVCVVLISLMGGTAVASAQPSTSQRLHLPRSRFVEVPESPGSSARIRIDTDLYLPATVPAPAVLLAHGFGQDKRDLAPEARRLQGEGYVVLAYSARGFGRSGGRIGLDSLDGEVPDARALVDVLARDPDVLRQLPRDPAAVQRHRDPVIGVVGASYGGALALMLGATDPRIDSVVAGITWNDLAQALDPVSAGWVRGTSSQQRLFKAAWAARLFGTGVAGSADPCSRFTADVCALYRTLVEGGDMSDADLALVRRSSPSSVLDRMTAPTLLVQGLQDSLFGLDQADANARQIRKAGAPVSVDWFDGGHDGGGVAGTERATDDWLDRTLKHPATPSRAFEFDVPASATSFAEHHVTSRYPGLFGRVRPVFLGLTGATQTVVNPPGGQPASVTSLPGIAVNSDAGLAAGALFAARNPPDQAARFVTSPLVSPSVLVGHAFARIRVTPVSGVAQDAVLFAQLTALTGSVRRALPGGVAPIHVRVPAGGATVYVALPATTWRFATGDRIELTVRTTDSQFLGSTAPAAFRVAGRGALLLPQLTRRAAASAVGMPSRATLWRAGLLLGLLLLLLVGVAVVGRLRMRTARLVEASAGEGAAPLQVRGVTKRFRSGFVAVDDVSFTVERGQVVGLLGENGAGKTTTMRMLLGLTRPDAGTISSFGARVVPGAPVLRRIGALVEGPGFLPHLSGRRNLLLYWAATGRPRRDARLDEVLAVADLGTAIRRRVGGYSQGMRQRLAIAQAMLGMPDLLVLDEPTNGLDPPQIVALRGVLRRYAEGPSTGSGGSPAGSQRTVIVSSHLLGEVERTCSHLVVMSHGRIVAAGPVAEIAGGTDELLLEVGDPAAAIAALAQLDLAKVQVAGTDAVRILPGTVPTGQVLVALVEAGVPVTGMRSERHLEDAFLDLIGEAGPKS